MTIKEEDFILESVPDTAFYDLQLLKKSPKTKKEEFKQAGYGIPLDHCIKLIIKNRLSNKQDTYTLREYLKAFQEESKSIKELFKQF